MVRFILILLIIFILIRIVTRYVLRSFIKNMQGNFENQKNQDSNKKEGDITINSQAKKDKKFDTDEGDYIDYEEVGGNEKGRK